MSKSSRTPRIDVVSDGPRRARRAWSDKEKLAIVCESRKAGVVVAQVARRHRISPSQFYDWRYRQKAGLLGGSDGFTEMIPVVEQIEGAAEAPTPKPDLVVDVGRRFRVTIPSGFDMTAAVALLRGLA